MAEESILRKKTPLRRQKLAPQMNGDCDHTVTITIDIPVFGPIDGRHDLIACARIMREIRNSVDVRAEGTIIDSEGNMAPCPTMESLIGKDE